MTNKDALDIMNKEHECLTRQLDTQCSFDCDNCDLVRTIPAVLEAQKIALRLMNVEEGHMQKFRNLCDGNHIE